MMFCEGIVILLVSREAITYKLDLASGFQQDFKSFGE